LVGRYADCVEQRIHEIDAVPTPVPITGYDDRKLGVAERIDDSSSIR
jgi:hypothetical protein